MYLNFSPSNALLYLFTYLSLSLTKPKDWGQDPGLIHFTFIHVLFINVFNMYLSVYCVFNSFCLSGKVIPHAMLVSNLRNRNSRSLNHLCQPPNPTFSLEGHSGWWAVGEGVSSWNSQEFYAHAEFPRKVCGLSTFLYSPHTLYCCV